MMSEIPHEHKDRLQAIMRNLLPGFRKVIDTAAEYNQLTVRYPFLLEGYDQTFECVIQPRDGIQYKGPVMFKNEMPNMIKSPTHSEVEVKACRLYIAFYKSMPGGSKDEALSSWERMRRETLDNPQGSEAIAYTGWIAVAREALS